MTTDTHHIRGQAIAAADQAAAAPVAEAQAAEALAGEAQAAEALAQMYDYFTADDAASGRRSAAAGARPVVSELDARSAA